jgi:hypothetical protein
MHGCGRVDDSVRLLERSIELFQEVRDPQGQAWAEFNLGACQLERGHAQVASDLLQDSIALFERHGDLWGQGYALRTLGAGQSPAGKAGPGGGLPDQGAGALPVRR